MRPDGSARPLGVLGGLATPRRIRRALELPAAYDPVRLPADFGGDQSQLHVHGYEAATDSAVVRFEGVRGMVVARLPLSGGAPSLVSADVFPTCTPTTTPPRPTTPSS